MLPQQPARARGGPPVDRTGDRLVTLAAVLVAATYLVASLIALALPDTTRHGLWLPLHLALAGGAVTAIAGVMPFFVAAFAAAPPADLRLRAAAVAAAALGAAAVAIGVPAGGPALPIAGGLLVIVAVLATGAASVRPVVGGLGASRGLVTRAYLAALLAVAVGVAIAVLLFAGWPPVASAWPWLKPAHAWLNVFGFVSLVIATTLLHFFPTVVGARIANHRSGRLTVAGVAGGAWLAAAGYALRIDPLVSVAAVVEVIGALALARYAWLVWRTRGRWTTDAAWHRFAIGGLASAIVWLVLGTSTAAVGALAAGSNPAGWSIDRVGGPLVAGWVGLAILASATHLIPAVGPGGPVEHGRQRALLGRWSAVRLTALNLGVTGLWAAGLTGSSFAGLAGLVLAATGALSTAALLVGAAAVGIRRR